MRSTTGPQVLDIWLLATVPGRKPITLHGESDLDGSVADAFDRMVPELVAHLRRRVVGRGRAT